MAKILRRTLTASGSRDSWQTYFEDIRQECSIITSVNRVSTSEVQVGINSECTMRFYTSGGTYFQFITPNGSSYDGLWFYGNVTLTSIYTDTLFYFQTHDNRYSPNGQRALFIYEIASGKCVYGWNLDSYFYPTAFRDIKTVTLTASGDSGVPYVHSALIPYSLDFDKIAYFDKDTLLNGSLKGLIDTNFMSCSNIAVDSVVTFNGLNYYSVGENTIIRID